MSCYVMSARCQAYKNVFTFDPLFLFEGTLTEEPALPLHPQHQAKYCHLMY